MENTITLIKNDDSLMNDIVGWDIRTWSKAVVFWDQKIDSNRPGLKCLEIGAGGGGLSLWLALKGHRVVCSNVRDSEQRASGLHRKYGISPNVEYQDIDATNIPYENHFDVVVFKSILGGIGRDSKALQQKAMEQVFKALKPGGRLLFAENNCGTKLHKLAREVAWAARGSSWRYVSVADIKDYLKDYTSYELHTTGVAAVFGLTEQQRQSLTSVDEMILNRIFPKSWRYMIYGMAIK